VIAIPIKLTNPPNEERKSVNVRYFSVLTVTGNITLSERHIALSYPWASIFTSLFVKPILA